MNEHFFDLLDNTGLIRNGVVDRDIVSRASVSSLIEIAEQSAEITSAEHLKPETTIFAHSASLSLGGTRAYCFAEKCRLNRAYELAQFALLYSDRVYIKNFLADHAPNATRRRVSSDTRFREFFTQDLKIINELRPLITRGVIVPFTPPLEYCPCCLAKQCLGSEGASLFQDVQSHLESDYLNKVTYNLKWDGRNYVMVANGPELLIEHGKRTVRYKEVPHALRHSPSILKRARNKKGVTFSTTELAELSLHKRYSNDVIENIAFELTTAQSLNTSFLTERPLHIELLNTLNQNPDVEYRNRIAEEHLTSFVPFLNDVSLKDLMKLREDENEAFILYRNALNKAIGEYRGQPVNFSAREAQSLYSDVVAPKLAALDQKVTIAKRALLKGTVRDAAAWVGTISFGVYTGFIPADLVAAAGVLGMGKVVADFLRTAMSRMSTTETIRNDDMYFLWRVRQLGKK